MSQDSCNRIKYREIGRRLNTKDKMFCAREALKKKLKQMEAERVVMVMMRWESKIAVKTKMIVVKVRREMF